ncbi:MAG: phosphoribosylanthranilate isomerase [Alphaproteobacteria bacterium]|jgi:phosphoribosylanthranilate isomerase
MAVQAKICGINDAVAMHAAIDGGADFVGLVFYPPSPRNVPPDVAAPLAELVPNDITRVGLFVDPDDALIEAARDAAGLDMAQLHGNESPARCDEVRQRFGLPVMKALKIAEAADLDAVDAYAGHVDWLMFDAKAPADMKGALPGGNALAFEWALLSGRSFSRPWMLAGGLNPANIAEAVRISGAAAVDVSSGVEAAPGKKDPAKIAAFLAAVRAL